MPLAAAHVAPAILLFNFLKKKLRIEKFEFSHAVFISAIGVLLPDADIFAGRFLQLFGYYLAHGSYTHTTFFALVFILPAIIFYSFKNTARLYFSRSWDLE